MPDFIRLLQLSAVFVTRIVISVVAFCLCGINSQIVLAAPSVAVSILPLQHLVAALSDGVSAPVLVLNANQDPHNISLRPSERRALADAALVVWIGPALELPLAEIMEQVSAKVLTIQKIAGLSLLGPADAIDPHLWLNTKNARLIAQATSHELSLIDPTNAQRYDENLQHFLQNLQLTHEQIQTQLSAHPITSWAVYHHAFAYFETEFGLPPALRLKESDNVEVGVRSARNFNQSMKAQQLTCIITEPGVNPATLRSLLDNQQLKVQTADILGLDLAVTNTSYNQLLLQVAQAISTCSGSKQ